MSGISLAIISTFFWGLNVILLRKIVRTLDPIAVCYYTLLPGLVIMGAASLAVDGWSFPSPPPWVGLGTFVAVGLLAFGMARILFIIGVKVIGPSRSSIILSTRVVLAPLISILILGEGMTVRSAIGALLIFVGLCCLATEGP